MAMQLAAQTRTQFGRAAKQLRAKGIIPAELYGPGMKNEHVEVVGKEFVKVLRHAGETSIVDLLVAGKKHPVFIHEVMRNPITDEVEGIDFYQVRLDQKIRIKVPVVFVGEAPGVKEKSGILVRSLNEIEVEALPTDIPHQIEVDLKGLVDIGNSVHVSEINVGKDVRVLVDPTFVVVTVTARMTEEQEAKLAAEGDVSAIKTEGEEKKAAAAAAEGEAAATTDAAAATPAAKPAAK